MHAHDRTLLAKLGFADPDKKDSIHDVACRYLAQGAQQKKLLSVGVTLPNHECVESGGQERDNNSGNIHSVKRRVGVVYHIGESDCQFEAPVSKGEGQYKTTIGFIDVLLRYKLERHENGTKLIDDGRAIPISNVAFEMYKYLAVEVKAYPVSASEIIRQLNLYREYTPSTLFSWLAATAFDISESELQQLKDSKIAHVKLGDGFLDFAAKETGASKPMAEAIQV